MCIDIVEIWFGIANEQILSILTGLSAHGTSVFFFVFFFYFRVITLVNISGFSPHLMCALILLRSALGLLMGKFGQFLTVICHQHIHILVSGQ